MGLFKKEDSDFKIKELIKRVEEAEKLTPSLGEFFAEQDYSCLWVDEDQKSSLLTFAPIVAVVLNLILLFIVLRK